MGWLTIKAAADQLGVSRRTLEGRVTKGEVPSYLEPDQGDPRRMVWVGTITEPVELLAQEVRDLRRAVERLSAGRPAGEVLRVTPPAPKPAQRLSAGQPKRPRATTPDTSSETWRAALEVLVSRAGSISAAGRLLGVNQSTASRWTSGARVPNRQKRARMVELTAKAAA